ncbi:hypothetical protein [Halorussus litoreus]|uniref:hypothetical protein n=1 Tax=Halorussus litoreus TaxID=1710536 RepID=UPI001300752A|nr:hypothetical protein [Halorussus litoreus]
MSDFSELPKRCLQLGRTSWDVYHREGAAQLIKSVANFLSTHDSREYALAILEYCKYKHEYGSSAPHPHDLVYINPVEINKWIDYTKIQEIDYLEHGTVIRDGDWDLQFVREGRTKPRFKKMAKSFERHFEEGTPWEDTELYQYALETPDIHEMYDPDNGNLEERLSKLDELYKELDEVGYKTQRELDYQGLLSERSSAEIPWFVPPEVHEIEIAVTRNGDLVWWGGNHRLHLTKILQLKGIPVRVVLRHKNWQDLRAEIARADSIGELSQKAREQITHPDMQDVIT